MNSNSKTFYSAAVLTAMLAMIAGYLLIVRPAAVKETQVQPLPPPRRGVVIPKIQPSVVANAPLTPASHEQPVLEVQLNAMFTEVRSYQNAWNREELYKGALAKFTTPEQLALVGSLLTAADPEDSEAKKRHAEARVMALKVFDVALQSGRSEDVIPLIREVALQMHDHGEVARNQRLDLEYMLRSYLGRNAAFVTDQDALANALSELGISLEEMRMQGLETPLGQAVVKGALTAALRYQKFNEVNQWIFPQRTE